MVRFGVLLLETVVLLTEAVMSYEDNTRKSVGKEHNDNKKPEFFLRCPTPATPSSSKVVTTVAFYHNNHLLITITNGLVKSFVPNANFNVVSWNTTDNFHSTIVKWKNERVKFEYEEKKLWYAMRIRESFDKTDFGQWKCRILTKTLVNGELKVAKYESRKEFKPVRQHYSQLKHKDQSNLTFLRSRDQKEREATQKAGEIKAQEKVKAKHDRYNNYEQKDDDSEGKEESKTIVNVKRDHRKKFSDYVLFTKPNEDFKVFQRVSAYGDIAYIRNHDIRDTDHHEYIKGGSMTNEEYDHKRVNMSSIHGLTVQNSCYNTFDFNIFLNFTTILTVITFYAF